MMIFFYSMLLKRAKQLRILKEVIQSNNNTVQELKHKINKILLNLEIPKIKIMKT